MGLPFYQAKVESDVRDKPAPKTTQLRSAIRRPHRRGSDRNLTNDATSSLRSRGAYLRWNEMIERNDRERTQPRDTLSGPSSLHARPRNVAPRTWAERATESGRFASHLAPRRRHAGLDDRTLAALGERWASLYTGANPVSPEPVSSSAVHQALSQNRPISGGYPRVLRGTPPSDLAETLRSATAEGFARPFWFGERSAVTAVTAAPAQSRTSGEAAATSPGDMGPTRGWESMPVDGLGDRERSLSPEGDSVWDTLLTTIAPDPQPPSVGSSFASTTSASAVNSQSTAAVASSGTSMTGRDTNAEESAFEQNCESGCDTEGDDEEEDGERNTLTRFRPRRWADIAARAASNGGNGEDPLEFLGDMQQIVRLFASRQDIPDEWWAEAGLSRTLSREASN